MKVVFVHLDWGIGGAEQLMLQLALASKDHQVELLTTRCDPDHCFAHLRNHPPHVYGAWIPDSFLGRFQVVFSTLRLLYLSFIVVHSHEFRDADLIVTDVLPTHLWILRYFTKSALLFYCHFPDRLLIRKNHADSSVFFRSYRYIMDSLESISMDLADTVAVNSKFTQKIVRESFPHLSRRVLPVLYPALEDQVEQSHKRERLIVSLNRFERKKNLGMLIEAVKYLRETYHDFQIPRIIIAGGYDSRNIENVEHRAELGNLVKSYGLSSYIQFEHSISDHRRHELLTKATAVVYTPDREHFGIVPVEAMAAGTPVVCCRSGGPKETVLDGTTGYLCDPPTDKTFGEALKILIGDPALVERMGAEAKKHAKTTFGMERLKKEWKEFVTTAVDKGKKRVAERGGFNVCHGLVFVVEAAFALLVCLGLTLLFQRTGILHEDESLLAGTKKLLGVGDEL